MKVIRSGGRGDYDGDSEEVRADEGTPTGVMTEYTVEDYNVVMMANEDGRGGEVGGFERE